MPGNGRAAPGRCTVPPWGGSGRAGRRSQVPASGSQEDGQRATSGPLAECLAEAGQLQRGALRLSGAALAAWIGGHLVPTPGGQEDGQTAHQRAGLRATGRMHGKGRMPPGWRGTPPWASLAERVGGTWSQLRAVRRTARRADSGPPEGHGPDARQWPGGSSAARCVALGGSGNN